jgi:hypothetical protein
MLAVTSFKEVLEWILKLKKQYNYNTKRDIIFNETGIDIRENESLNTKNSFRVGIDIPYLRHPKFLDAQYCDDEMLKNYMIPCLEFMIDNTSENPYKMHLGFEKSELEKFQRIVENRIYFKHQNDINLAKFFDFVNLIDKRRNVNFLETFPEMSNFFNSCKQARNRF